MLEEFYPESRRGNHFGSIIRYIELLQGLHLIVPPLFQLSSIAFLKTVVQNTSQGRCCDELWMKCLSQAWVLPVWSPGDGAMTGGTRKPKMWDFVRCRTSPGNYLPLYTSIPSLWFWFYQVMHSPCHMVTMMFCAFMHQEVSRSMHTCLNIFLLIILP